MKTLSQVGERLQIARKDSRITQQELATRTGLTPVTMRAVFGGKTDARISTIMALADKLGLELLLVPKEISESLEPQRSSATQVKSKISQIVHRDVWEASQPLSTGHMSKHAFNTMHDEVKKK